MSSDMIPLTRFNREIAAARGKLDGIKARPPTPAKQGSVVTPAPTLRRFSFYGTPVIVEAPAESTPDTPALLKKLRDAGVSKVLSLLSDEALKDESTAAAAAAASASSGAEAGSFLASFDAMPTPSATSPEKNHDASSKTGGCLQPLPPQQRNSPPPPATDGQPESPGTPFSTSFADAFFASED